MIPKEVKFVTIHKDLRSHQYLDDWLVRARSQAFLQHTQELVNNVSATGLADELTEREPKQNFDFVGYQFDFRSDRFRPTLDR